MEFTSEINAVDVEQALDFPSIIKGMNKAVGAAVADLYKSHFTRLNQMRHRSPNDNIGFYQRAADGTSYTVDSDGATVTVTKTGILQRWRGGVITAKNSKYLTIPAIPEALSLPASSFTNLRAVRFGKGEDAPLGLIENTSGAKSAKTGKKIKYPGRNVQGAYPCRVFYWLKKSVFQEADESVLPSQSEVIHDASMAATSFLRFKVSEMAQ